MKKTIFSAVLALACVAAFGQSKNVSVLGSAIDPKQGEQWIRSYQSHFGKSDAICYGKNIMMQMLNAPDVKGVYIVRGLDASSNEVLIFRTSDENGTVNSNMIVSNGVHHPVKNVAASGTLVTNELANQMISKFQTSYPERTQGYLYGKEGFEKILQQKDAEGILFVNGLDENSAEHLILFGADKKGNMIEGLAWNHGSGIGWLIDLFARH